MFETARAPRKPHERVEARRLRREDGLTLRSIAARLGVSPSTVLEWTRDIELTQEQQEAIRSSDAAREARAAGNWAMRSRARQRRLAAQDHGRQLARQEDPLHLTGCMLYWAEGSRPAAYVERSPEQRPRASGDRNVVVRPARSRPSVPRLSYGQQLLQGVDPDASRPTTRNGPRRGSFHVHRPEHLWGDSGIRRDRTDRVGRSLTLESRRIHSPRGRLAQVVERGPYKAEAAGSSPAAPILAG
jgi:Helix-turn-helix domain